VKFLLVQISVVVAAIQTKFYFYRFKPIYKALKTVVEKVFLQVAIM